MLEPRGHADMCGAILTEPVSPGSHAGVLFMRQRWLRRRCPGTASSLSRRSRSSAVSSCQAATARSVILDTLAGTIRARANVRRRNGGVVERVLSERALVRAARRRCGHASARGASARTSPTAGRSTPSSTARPWACRSTGRTCRSFDEPAWRSLARSRRAHPSCIRSMPGCGGIAGTIFTGPPRDERAALRNVAVFADGTRRPIAVRDGNRGGHGRSRRDGAARVGRAVRAREPDRHVRHRTHRRPNDGRRLPGHRAGDRGLRVDHRRAHVRDRRGRSAASTAFRSDDQRRDRRTRRA